VQAATGQRDRIKIFGRDYPTDDGTCVRDYIHICDLAAAHDLALKQLVQTNETRAYNLGNGRGFSVQQVVDIVREVSGVDFAVEDDERRPGDPAVLVADARRAQADLGWQPQYDDLRSIVAHAWAFESARWRDA
jgi:UDP-glucose 4-epimerase